MKLGSERRRPLAWLLVWGGIAILATVLQLLIPGLAVLPSGLSLLQVAQLVAAILAGANLAILISHMALARQHKPPVEGVMVGRIYYLLAGLIVILGLAYAFGQLGAFGSFLSLFGGMLLGWSLQAPVSGFAAYVLVSLMRPFRPGDRIQFPNLGLVGDVKDVGIMYTRLDQVGGSIGSEEAVGRYILVPNAMLFSQVVINYTVVQEAPYMLDEVIIRITYDSDWQKAEVILLSVAREVTQPIIDATNTQPYIRSDMYDYGVYLRLRYQTEVNRRAEIAYLLSKRICEEIQRTRAVDLAIPYVYSYRAGAERLNRDREGQNAQEIDMSKIDEVTPNADPHDIELLAQSIASQGLLQPIVVARNPLSDRYHVVAGDLRCAACRQLGWRTIPAVVVERPEKGGGHTRPAPPVGPN
jgi:small-conductance mechanosensitive channel